MVTEPAPVDEVDAHGGLVVVVAGGDDWPDDAVRAVPHGAVVVAADSGADHAVRAGLVVHHLVGDLDSVSPAARAAVERAGGRVHVHPVDKDFTDLELALEVAVGLLDGRGRLLVVGGHGGRLDHFLANVALLAAPRWEVDAPAVELVAWVGSSVLRVVRGGAPPVALDAPVGAVVTLLPQHGPALGVRTSGLRYPLHGEDLAPGSSRGVSNVVDEGTATVALRTGTLLVVQPLPTPEDES